MSHIITSHRIATEYTNSNKHDDTRNNKSQQRRRQHAGADLSSFVRMPPQRGVSENFETDAPPIPSTNSCNLNNNHKRPPAPMSQIRTTTAPRSTSLHTQIHVSGITLDSGIVDLVPKEEAEKVLLKENTQLGVVNPHDPDRLPFLRVRPRRQMQHVSGITLDSGIHDPDEEEAKEEEEEKEQQQEEEEEEEETEQRQTQQGRLDLNRLPVSRIRTRPLHAQSHVSGITVEDSVHYQEEGEEVEKEEQTDALDPNRLPVSRARRSLYTTQPSIQHLGSGAQHHHQDDGEQTITSGFIVGHLLATVQKNLDQQQTRRRKHHDEDDAAAPANKKKMADRLNFDRQDYDQDDDHHTIASGFVVLGDDADGLGNRGPNNKNRTVTTSKRSPSRNTNKASSSSPSQKRSSNSNNSSNSHSSNPNSTPLNLEHYGGSSSESSHENDSTISLASPSRRNALVKTRRTKTE